MEITTYQNDDGDEVVIATMDNNRLINAIAKYANLLGKDNATVKALKAEAVKRLSEKSNA